MNRSAAGMSRSGTVDESCRHRRSIVLMDFHLFHPDSPRFYRLAKIGVNRGQNRECLTGALSTSSTSVSDQAGKYKVFYDKAHVI